jgi:hypothetical protein
MSFIPSAKDYQSMKLDQIDENANWFRHHFVGKPYQTFIGSLQSSNITKLPLVDTDKSKNKKQNSTPKRRNSKSMISSFLSSSNVHQQTQQQQQFQHQQQQILDQSSSTVGIISVVQERAKDFSGPGNGAAAILGSQYRIIIRSREV